MKVYPNNRGKLIVDIEFTHPDGRVERVRKTSPVQTKRGAEQYGKQVEQALLNGTYGKRAAEDVPTLAGFKEAFIGWCRAERHKPTGIESKESHFRRYLLPLFGNKRLNEFGAEDQRVLRERCAKLSVSTYNTSASILNKLMDVAIGEKRLGPDRFAFGILRVPEKKMSFYDFAQYERLVSAAQSISPVAECIVLLGGDAGLRRSEMFGLTYGMCDLVKGKLIIEQAETIIRGERFEHETKGLNSRDIKMTDRLRDALKRNRHKLGDRVLFIDGKAPIKSSFMGLLRRVQREAGLPLAKGNAHILRHTFCSHLAANGVPIMTIKELAGHAKIETTLRYMHLAPGAKDSAIADLEKFRSGNLAATAAE